MPITSRSACFDAIIVANGGPMSSFMDSVSDVELIDSSSSPRGCYTQCTSGSSPNFFCAKFNTALTSNNDGVYDNPGEDHSNRHLHCAASYPPDSPPPPPPPSQPPPPPSSPPPPSVPMPCNLSQSACLAASASDPGISNSDGSPCNGFVFASTGYPQQGCYAYSSGIPIGCVYYGLLAGGEDLTDASQVDSLGHSDRYRPSGWPACAYLPSLPPPAPPAPPLPPASPLPPSVPAPPSPPPLPPLPPSTPRPYIGAPALPLQHREPATHRAVRRPQCSYRQTAQRARARTTCRSRAGPRALTPSSWPTADPCLPSWIQSPTSSLSTRAPLREAATRSAPAAAAPTSSVRSSTQLSRAITMESTTTPARITAIATCTAPRRTRRTCHRRWPQLPHHRRSLSPPSSTCETRCPTGIPTQPLESLRTGP